MKADFQGSSRCLSPPAMQRWLARYRVQGVGFRVGSVQSLGIRV